MKYILFTMLFLSCASASKKVAKEKQKPARSSSELGISADDLLRQMFPQDTLLMKIIEQSHAKDTATSKE
jgi:hypothetical protein